MQMFCVFMILWNVVAFTGHSLASFVDSAHFIREGGYLTTRIEGPFTSVKLWFYFTKLDHLFSVPALLFLYLAMKGIYKSSCEVDEI